MLDDSDQTKKYGISESMIQALYYDIVCNNVIIRACIMESEMPSFGHYHQAPGASCGILYIILVLSLVLFMQSIIPFLIYEIFHLLVSFHFFNCF